MAWKDNQLIGFSVKNLDEINRVMKFGVNMMEINPHCMAQSGFPLYSYENRSFVPNGINLTYLKNLLKGVVVQIHLPTETTVSINIEKGLNVCVKEHQDIILDWLVMFERIYRKYRLGSVLTWHPPVFSENNNEIFSEKYALKKAKRFFMKLDGIRIKYGYRTKIAIENMTHPKVKAGNLGYQPNHFKKMLCDTRTFGLTIDTGHLRLATKADFANYLALGIPIFNFHFNGNGGVFNPNDWSDDEHLLPRPGNVSGYKKYPQYFRRHRTPIVLEISHLENYSDAELKDFLKKLKKQIA
ncbi:MAG: hypothetical protein US83_C0004G0056 [Candidatus Falkowbacteria bacterium GW2011_GWC2_38_22]|uniref:Xylose isomerase-like TIM barrel domain-containing protein n=1 Tax=Candidatus Falkowbacteria bacterium GW2011_GWE1_38_31 TaxID=1618638 RepID=A0A0G0N0D4_9BACT|nr:MAG: hypothetical protein US73_C0002G0061 [Candidatus Falkowbacteria bacterium GW2011_GWF2_38_1205]KKQ61672.1 MAG: hypothetical protein US83_C0004G0056 [Candidatus Falkowbacteria bacterium GW2011_GWC2_38_22]KKQ63713.1 MAG: hypothetical protein US84_C0004G0061 [Candidatus Falkowbacteria bacterium GW2011_GWF1_38_22]KKQ65871.1 MAG: hypothetical protein US87_C0004G0056 [Candidatus Falkowbacteria bacterium GW2011_GWE2_38_254]KKQ70576.1 MAG: hypothetical protein US91_C0004G0061 [Candidatus Falkowb